MFSWFLIFLSAGLFTLTDSFAASWGKTGNAISLVLMVILAPLAYLVFGLLNQRISLSVSSGLVNLILIAGTIFVGVFFFGDQLTIRQGIGLFIAVIAIALLG